MGINIQNIVNVDFNILQSEPLLTAYSTVVYCIKGAIEKDKTFTKATTATESGLDQEIVNNINYFFACGGQRLIVTNKFITSAEDKILPLKQEKRVFRQPKRIAKLKVKSMQQPVIQNLILHYLLGHILQV